MATLEDKWLGKRVKVSEGAGADSRRQGIVVPKREVPTDGHGIPRIGAGHYSPMSKTELAIVDDNGRLFTMFVRYLDEVDGFASDRQGRILQLADALTRMRK